MLRPAPTDRLISVAPGAAPCSRVPSVSVVSRPATMPATCVPCPPADRVSVSLTAVRSRKHESWGSGSGRPRSASGPQMFFMLSFTALEPSALRRNGCVPSTPVSMTAADTPRPSTGRPCPSRSCARACSPRVATFEVDRYSRIGWSPSTYVTPACPRTAAIWAAVPRATATLILFQVVTSVRPVSATAWRAASMLVPCTNTGIGPVAVVSVRASAADTGASGLLACAGETDARDMDMTVRTATVSSRVVRRMRGLLQQAGVTLIYLHYRRWPSFRNTRPSRPRSASVETIRPVGQVAGERGRGAHAPRIGDQLPQAIDVHQRQPQHDQRHPVVAGRGEEGLGLAQQQSLLLRLVAHVQHGDVGPDGTWPARSALGIGPDEPLVADPEVEAFAVDLDHVRQRQCQPADILGISHPDRSWPPRPACAQANR